MTDSDAIKALQEQLERWNFTPYGHSRWTEEQLVAVEADLGSRLPEDFRWFCLTHGTGYLGTPPTIEMDGVDPALKMEFARLGPHSHEFSSGLQHTPPYFPPGLISCASDVMGMLYFLRVAAANTGSVSFWHASDGDGPEWRPRLARVADSFTDLLASAQNLMIKTERLTLRAFEPDDSGPLFHILGSPRTMKLMPRGLLTNTAEAEALIDERRFQEREMHYSIWAIVLRSTGQLIGNCGFRPSAEGGPFELGYVIDHNYWGEGYATEAAQAAIDRVFANNTVPNAPATAFATIRPINEPSIAVARRLGMHQVGSVADEHGELLKFEIDKQL